MRRRQASDEHILTYIALNPAVTRRDLLRKFGGSNNHLNDLLQRVRSARDYERKAQEYPVPTDDLAVVKKVGEVDWREWFAQAKTTQELASKASFSQDFAIIDIQRQFGITGPVVIWHISDLHMGSGYQLRCPRRDHTGHSGHTESARGAQRRPCRTHCDV